MPKSKIFFWILIAFILGIIAGELNSQILFLGVLLLGVIITALNYPRIFYGFLIISFSLGALRFASSEKKFFPDGENFLLQRIERRINRILPEPQASFLAGLLLGVKRNLPEDLLEDFKRTSTTHIIVLSGYNITIIAVLLTGFLNLLTLPRKYSFYLAALGIIGFVWLVGPSPSVIRAMIMGILLLLTIKINRLYNKRNVLAFTAFLMLLYDPYQLLHSISFQLSFAATLGIVYLYPKLSRLGEILGTTLAAQATVFPIIFFYFREISLIAPLANLLILPAVPFSLLFGSLGILLGKFFAWPAWLFLTYEIKVVGFLADLPWAAIKF